MAVPALAAAALAFDGSIAYPGAWALVPTLAAAALIVRGREPTGRGASWPCWPLRFLGRISYSLYLWHWPALVLPLIALEAEPPPEMRAVLVAVAVGAAWLSWRFVEEPFRTGFPTLARRPGRTVLAGATAVLAVVVASGAFVAAAEEVPGLMPDVGLAATTEGVEPFDEPGDELVDGDIGDIDGLESSEEAAELEALEALLAMDGPRRGPNSRQRRSSARRRRRTPSAAPSATARAPAAAPSATALPSPTPRIHKRLPKDVRPPLSEARADEERLRADGCLAFEPVRVPPDCVYGDRKGKVTVALVGDSHAAQWFPALAAVARRRHWRLVTFTKVACPFLDMRVSNVALKREYWECAEFRTRTIARLRKLKPDLVLVSMSRFAIHPVRTKDAVHGGPGRGAGSRHRRRCRSASSSSATRPTRGRDVPSCLSRHTRERAPLRRSRSRPPSSASLGSWNGWRAGRPGPA